MADRSLVGLGRARDLIALAAKIFGVEESGVDTGPTSESEAFSGVESVPPPNEEALHEPLLVEEPSESFRPVAARKKGRGGERGDSSRSGEIREEAPGGAHLAWYFEW